MIYAYKTQNIASRETLEVMYLMNQTYQDHNLKIGV